MRAKAARVLGVVGLGAAIALAVGVRWVSPERVQDLHPRPDAVEYVEAARRLGSGEGYWLHLAGEKYPPRYPFGFSLLLMPVVSMSGDERSGIGIWVVLATAVAAVLVSWELGRRIGGGSAALATALLLAAAPLHARLSRAVLSDVPSSAALAGVSLLALRAMSQGAAAPRWALVGCATSLATMIRTPSIVFLMPVSGIILLAGQATLTRRLRNLAGLITGAVAGISPLLIYNWRCFGSPLVTGYVYWVPGSFFGTRFVFGTPEGGGTEPNAIFYGRALLGQSDLYPWPVAVLVALGIVQGVRASGEARILTLLTLGVVGAFYVLQCAFFWQAERFLLPVVPLIAVVAALPIAPSGGRLVRAVGVVLVVLALGVGLRSHSYAPPDRDWAEVAGLQALANQTESNAVVLARTNAVFFEQFLRKGGADRLWIPLGLDEWQLPIRLHRLKSYGAVAGGGWMLPPVGPPVRSTLLRERVRRLLKEGRPVYVWSFRSFDLPFFSELLSALRTEFALETSDPGGRWSAFRVISR